MSMLPKPKCQCPGHRMPGVHHMVACCDKPHVDLIRCPKCGEKGHPEQYCPERLDWRYSPHTHAGTDCAGGSDCPARSSSG